MSSISTRGARLLKSMEIYSKNHKKWDASQLIPRINIATAKDGHMVGTFKVTDDICNIAGTLHGGFITAAIDYFTFYSIAQHPKGAFSWTTDMNVSFLNITKLGETVSIEAKPIKLMKSRAVMECLLSIDGTDQPIAKGTVGFSIPTRPLIFMDMIPYDSTVQDE